MNGLAMFFEKLVAAGIVGEMWVDGSFLTEKIDPNDVDVVVRCPGALYDLGTVEQRQALDWVIANQKVTMKCDSYVLFEYPTDHPLREQGEWMYSYWHVKWGFTRQPDEDPKGIVVVAFDSGSL
jgi:hypothetical protein